MRAMDRPSQNHRDPWFAPFFKEILEDTKVKKEVWWWHEAKNRSINNPRLTLFPFPHTFPL